MLQLIRIPWVAIALTVLVLLITGSQSARLEDTKNKLIGADTSIGIVEKQPLKQSDDGSISNNSNSAVDDHLWSRSLSSGQFVNIPEPVVLNGPDSSTVYDELDAWEAPFNISNEYVYYLAGHDDENRPIWIVEAGRWNIRSLVEGGGPKLAAFNKYMKQLVHRMIKSLAITSIPECPVTELMYLADFDELRMEQLAHLPTVSYVLGLARDYTGVLRQHLGGTIIVNTNFVAENLINLLRPVFGPLMEKVEVYGNNRAAWLPRVLRKYPRDQLPEWYGGTKDFKPVQVYG